MKGGRDHSTGRHRLPFNWLPFSFSPRVGRELCGLWDKVARICIHPWLWERSATDPIILIGMIRSARSWVSGLWICTSLRSSLSLKAVLRFGTRQRGLAISVFSFLLFYLVVRNDYDHRKQLSSSSPGKRERDGCWSLCIEVWSETRKAHTCASPHLPSSYKAINFSMVPLLWLYYFSELHFRER